MKGDEKRVAIVQSSYIPWKGYFDLVNLADEFVLFDDRQFTRRDWRNRNRIKTPQGLRWLTIPVKTKGRFDQRIDETLVEGDEWRRVHWKTLQHVYESAPFFARYSESLKNLYLGSDERRLSQVNRTFIEAVCGLLGIETTLAWSTDYAADGGRSERLLSICLAADATTYLSGPRAQAYLDVPLFERHGVKIEWMDYAGYAEYPQLYPPFEHSVSILDLLFSVGPEAPRYMKSLA